MQEQDIHIEQLADHFFRQESGKMVAVLVKIFGTEHLELAEDVVQDALLSALQTWKQKGIPDNPAAWLFRTAKNKAIDIIRRNKHSTQFDFSDPDRVLLRSEYTLERTMDNMWKDEVLQDDLLQMMYAACDEGISPENQVTLILKTLCGFNTQEVAKAFLTTEEVISKRLYRAKEFFREHKIRPEFPPPQELKERTEAVLKALYLLFNEGYNSTHPDELIRADLVGQAMYLCKQLCINRHTQLPQAYALMALMCFHASRLDSRMSSEGEIILLSEQDRSQWDKELVDEGRIWLNRASFGDSLSTYHIEAAIAFEHCTAETFESTNWERILLYYDWLCRIAPSAVATLNRLIVVFKLKGAAAALEALQSSGYEKEWEKYYLYHALLGELYAGTDHAKAKAAFEKAMKLTQSKAEIKLVEKKIEALRPLQTSPKGEALIFYKESSLLPLGEAGWGSSVGLVSHPSAGRGSSSISSCVISSLAPAFCVFSDGSPVSRLWSVLPCDAPGFCGIRSSFVITPVLGFTG